MSGPRALPWRAECIVLMRITMCVALIFSRKQNVLATRLSMHPFGPRLPRMSQSLHARIVWSSWRKITPNCVSFSRPRVPPTLKRLWSFNCTGSGNRHARIQVMVDRNLRRVSHLSFLVQWKPSRARQTPRRKSRRSCQTDEPAPRARLRRHEVGGCCPPPTGKGLSMWVRAWVGAWVELPPMLGIGVAARHIRRCSCLR